MNELLANEEFARLLSVQCFQLAKATVDICTLDYFFHGLCGVRSIAEGVQVGPPSVIALNYLDQRLSLTESFY